MENTKDWNEDLLKLFIPVHILLVLFLLTGTIGNLLVIVVYGFKMKKIKDGQFFIPYLAVADLLGSIVCSLFGLSMTLMPVVFDSDRLCKAGWLLGSTTTFLSVFLLVTIAIQRYLKVCRQNSPALTLRIKRILLFFASIMSVALACPTVVTYGSIPFEIHDKNLTGFICGKIHGKVSLIYDLIIGIAVIVCCGLLIVLYFLVGRRTYKYMKRRELVLKSMDIRGRVVETSTMETDLKTTGSGDLVTSVNESAYVDLQLQENSREDSGKVGTCGVSSTTKRNNTHKRKMSRITIMFLVITVIFLVCSLPKLTIVILETVITDFWQNISDTERAVLLFIHQGYILNNVVNPIIYTFLDENFKSEIKKMFCCKFK